MLLTIAAAFMLLPALLAYRLFPELAPDTTTVMTRARMVRIWPMMTVLGLVQLYGQLAVIAVATDGGRATVGAALRRAFLALPRVLGGVLLFLLGAFLIVVAVSLVVGIVVAVGAPAMATDRRFAATTAMLMMLPLLWVLVRLSLFAVRTLDADDGPLATLRWSWRATAGHAAGITVNLVLAALALFAVQGLVALVVGSAARVIDALLGGHVARLLAEIVSGGVGAAASVALTLLVVTIWSRLRRV